jgi:predicted pyridoxine 5'-phosphate oxidase superfamily flavin-nucleotide-binding protein
MTKSFGSLVFTPAVKALQERYGSRRQYARLEQLGEMKGGLGPDEKKYLSERDTFYMASLGESGWPYVQHRGGPKGFLKVIDDTTLAFADFRGNKQYISTGNLLTDNRVALIVVDYPRQLRLKLLGRVEIFEGEKANDWLPKVRDPDYRAVTERVYVIRIEAFDWNCQQHIIPRYTEEEIRDVLEPIEKQMQALQKENEELRNKLSRLDGKTRETS